MTQFGRIYSIEVGPPGELGDAWTDLEMSFQVTKSTKRSDNKATFKLFNLSRRHIGTLERQTELRVRLFAGYEGIGLPQLIFQGRVGSRGAMMKREGSDLVTTLECIDSLPKAKASSRSAFNFHFEAGSTNREILATIVRETSIPVGHISELPLKTYKSGITFMGSTREALNKLTAPSGFGWSVQDGRLQIIERGLAIPRTAVLLTKETGLVGTPERTDKGVNGRALLNPNIRPGWPVRIESEFATGFWRVVTVTHAGDFRANDWNSDFEARKIKA